MSLTQSVERRPIITVPRIAILAIALLAAAWYFHSNSPARQVAVAETPTAPTWDDVAASVVLAIKGGSLQKAYRLHDEARAMVTPAQPGDIRPAQTLMLLAEIHESAEKPAAAEAAYRDAVAAGEQAIGPNNPALLQLLDALANFYYYHDRFDEAVPVYERMLSITESAPNAAPRDVANRARNLAALYEQVGRYADAEPLYRKALAAGEQAGPVFESDLIQDMLTVAVFYRTQKNYAESESLAKQALALAEKSTGPNSMDAATALDVLAETLLAAGRSADAEPFATRSLTIVEHANGADSPDVAPRLVALAAIAAAEQKNDAADAHIARAMQLTATAVGEDSPEIAALLARYADLLDTMHLPTEAAARREQADLILHPPVHEPTLAE